MSEKQCTTHHHACDCREAAHKAEVAALRALVGELVEQADLVLKIAKGDGWPDATTGRQIAYRLLDESVAKAKEVLE